MTLRSSVRGISKHHETQNAFAVLDESGTDTRGSSRAAEWVPNGATAI